MSTCRSVRVLIAWLSLTASAIGAEPSAEARRLYAEGKTEYAQGHYDAAVTLFERSYALSESPALLFNMAQAYRLAGPEHCAQALKLYQSYLQAEPKAENKQEVDERIEQLGDCTPPPPARAPLPPPESQSSGAPQLRPAPKAPPARVTPRPPPRSAARLGPVLVSGAGATLLVAGGVLYTSAWREHRQAEKVCPCYPGSFSKWEVLSNVSYALLAVGGATLAGGVTWWVTASPVAPQRAVLNVEARF
jgi:tetratricopeptide (TPR) repeat protein